MFLDEKRLKDAVRMALLKPTYSVADFYWEDGFFPRLATNNIFENLTLGVISLNALYIAVQTDNDTSTTLLDADPFFQVCEHAFCVYFSFEWFVRFMSFKRKIWGLKDGWFVFDSLLVFMMVSETWVLTVVMVLMGGGGGKSPLGNASILRLLRLLRLSRLLRMLRSMPELLILIKGMVSAGRSVLFTLCLLLIIIYIFAIALTQLTAGTPIGGKYFPGIPKSMVSLLLYGTFCDSLSTVTWEIGDPEQGGLVFACIFLIFVALSALMVMNMLIGVLCEVVSAVAATEKEEGLVNFVRDRMLAIVDQIDQNGDRRISRKEFNQILNNKEACMTLQEVGVDPIGIVDFADFIFEAENEETGEPEERELDFSDFMEEILNFRDSETATVKHFVDLTKVVRAEVKKVEGRMDFALGRTNTKKRASRKSITVSPPSSPPPPATPPTWPPAALPLLQEPESPPAAFTKVKSNGSVASVAPAVLPVLQPDGTHFVESLLLAEMREIEKLGGAALPGMPDELGHDDSDTSSAKLQAWSANTAKFINQTLADLRKMREKHAAGQICH
eukprot:gnl/TRDRNA2_/TRDRNA2_176717_c2_seq2.p1 gnl/TRDRNA2_/TRDRNA2_176717_c2~~gnl/TRDRNA2_/TRDRNA2_176717_c2_seq2.p1  ORF type:complete len:580 (+),score=103.78 gnl/TRDRNA2_/TRDRNA2_176717_c2_seq2:66-1742(+)